VKVMTILGTRPELIKLSAIIKKLDKHTDHVFVHTGQNYDPQLSDVFYKDLGLRKPDIQLEWHGSDLGGQLASSFFDIQPVLTKEAPDAVVILGDTNSGIAAGYLAKRMKIPLFHLEAGNRCFDDNVPEEINRRVLDHISDVNMVYTENSRRYLLAEGIAKERVFIMGSPMKEIFNEYRDNIMRHDAVDRLGLDSEYFLVSIHRDENTEIPRNLNELAKTLNAIANRYKLPIIVTTHPRFMKKIESEGLSFSPLVRLEKPFGLFDYIQLQRHAKCVISDSGTIAEESSILGFPAVTIRNAIERPEAVDVGSILIAGVNKDSILNCLDIVSKPTTIPADYDVDNCSDRVLKVILGYTGYINRYVWHKS
jgi:UDP-N-acetylglucosamine 2-epimerase